MKTVLLVDDEMFARDYLGRVIEKQGFRVVSASSGEEGIIAYREHRPDYVFLDILLPGIDGEEVLRYIKDIDDNAAVVFITGCDNICSPEQAEKLGARGFLSKPIFAQDVIDMLNRLQASDAVQN